MQQVSINEIMLFMQNIIDVFGVYLLYAFTIMITFSLLFGIKKLILGGKYHG